VSYQVDHAALVKTQFSPSLNPIEQVEAAVDLLASLPPDFDRAWACNRCRDWDEKEEARRLDLSVGRKTVTPLPLTPPSPPGAFEPRTSCSGCIFAILDEVDKPRRIHGARRRVRELRLSEFETTHFTKPGTESA